MAICFSEAVCCLLNALSGGKFAASLEWYPPPPPPLFLRLPTPQLLFCYYFFFFFAAALQQEERPDYVGINKKRLDPLAFQQAPKQKRGAQRLLSIQRLPLLHVWSSLISRAASWPGSHLIHASVFISLSILAMKKKMHTYLCFCSPTPQKRS